MAWASSCGEEFQLNIEFGISTRFCWMFVYNFINSTFTTFQYFWWTWDFQISRPSAGDVAGTLLPKIWKDAKRQSPGSPYCLCKIHEIIKTLHLQLPGWIVKLSPSIFANKPYGDWNQQEGNSEKDLSIERCLYGWVKRYWLLHIRNALWLVWILIVHA